MRMDFEHFNIEKPPVDTERFYHEFSSSFDEFKIREDDEEFQVKDEDAVEKRKPTTPIEHALRKAPKTIQEIKTFINERLQIKGDINLVSSHDQQELASTLMSELSAVWPEMRNQAPDPFLSREDNKELERKVAITVVNIVEKLYKEYIEKLQAANAKKIFNAASNISRFKTQLSFDANKSLNILNIRRKLAKSLRHPLKEDENLSEDSFVIRLKQKISQSSQKKRGSIVKKLEMTREFAQKLYHEFELEDLNSKLPILSREDHIFIRPNSVTATKQRFLHEDVSDTVVTQIENTDLKPNNEYEISDKQQENRRLQKSNSLPLVDTSKLFLEELEIKQQDLNNKRKASFANSKVAEDIINKDRETSQEKTQVNLRNDLQDLLHQDNSTEKMATEDSNLDLRESMPPLLQAMPEYNKKSLKIGNKNLDAQSELSLTSTVATDDTLNSLMDEDEIKSLEQLPVQPSIVTTKLPNKVFARTSDVRISNRQNASNITLNRHKTIYNNFKGEIDDVMVKQLDRNLFAGDEIKEVYEEVVKTINKVHLQFDKDDFIIKCPEALESFDLFASNLLQNTKTNKIFNEKISGCIQPPWSGQGADEWRNSPKFGGLGRQEILELKANAPRDLIMQEHSYDKTVERKPTKSYAAWLAWWRSTINSEDYYKYISVKDNDFLSKVFHLYDSGDDDDEDDSSKDSTVENPEELAKRKLMQEKQKELQVQKERYQTGFWNVNTVLLGGLGKTPAVEPESSASRTVNEKKNSKSRLTSSLSLKNSKVSSVTGMQFNDDQGSEYLHPPEITFQDRLERIWDRLRMPENLRLDMAIKYSLDKNNDSLIQAISSWENAVDRIAEREELIGILEKFERIASDPNRFFQKGPKGSSLNRLDESKSRECIHKRLNQLDVSTKKAILAIQFNFKDIVTYEGRPYLDKLSCDRIEMLYWLQQERRSKSIEKEYNSTETNSKVSELPPISTLTLL